MSNLTRANLVAREPVAGEQDPAYRARSGKCSRVRRFKGLQGSIGTGKPIEFAEVLVRELTNFREKITESANMTYEARQGTHDDLVLAACLPIWLGSQRFCSMRTRGPGPDDDPGLQRRETAAMGADQAAVETAELEAAQDGTGRPVMVKGT